MTGRSCRVATGGKENRAAALVFDVARHGEMGTVAIDCVPVEVEVMTGVAGEVLRLVRPQMGDHIGRVNGTGSHCVNSLLVAE